MKISAVEADLGLKAVLAAAADRRLITWKEIATAMGRPNPGKSAQSVARKYADVWWNAGYRFAPICIVQDTRIPGYSYWTRVHGFTPSLVNEKVVSVPSPIHLEWVRRVEAVFTSYSG